MDENKVIIPFDSGKATIVPGENSKFKIIITKNGIEYEFNASPAGIESFSIDGGKVREYRR